MKVQIVRYATLMNTRWRFGISRWPKVPPTGFRRAWFIDLGPISVRLWHRNREAERTAPLTSKGTAT